MRELRQRLGPLLAGLLALTLAGGCAITPVPRFAAPPIPAEQAAQAARNREVFERVWRLVADHHYDRQLRGVDWRAAAERFGPQAVAAAGEAALYRVLNAMLAPLEDSHTHALTPARASGGRVYGRARDSRWRGLRIAGW